jgi:Domain of unknown function (DUF4105)
LRINKSENDSNEEHSELLDHGISYAAVVTQDNPILYAVYGLFGLFQGTFTKVPYFYKIREYNDYESRDLWEYRLALDQQQIEILVAHLWELGSTYFKYYYLTQNCAYHIITALQAALPERDLVDRMPTVAIPVDGLKALTSSPGLVKEIRFRPSLRTRWQNRLETLTSNEKSALKQVLLAANNLPPSLSDNEKLKVYDASLDYIDLRHYKELILEPEGEASTKKQKLLAARSDVPLPSHELTSYVRNGEPPHQGHDSMRVGLGQGTTFQSSFTEVSLRFALHDLLDPSTGYPTYSEVEFFDFSSRFDLSSHRLSPEDLTLFKVVSLSPIDSFHAPFSWKAKLGGIRIHDNSCASCFAGSAEVGGGWTVEILRKSAALFLTADTQLAAAPGFYQSFFRLGLGPTLGMRLQLSSGFIGLFSVGYRHQFFSPDHDILFSNGEIRWAFQNRFALSLRGVRWPENWESAASAYYYF